MEDYKPNSHKSREGATTPDVKERMEKVVTGEVKLKKKTGIRKFADVFIVEDIRNVLGFVWTDLIVPATKEIAYNSFTSTLDYLMYGISGGGRNRKTSSGSRTSYDRFYERERDRDRRDAPEPRTRSKFDYEDVIFKSRGDADLVLAKMQKRINKYKYVTVLDLYDMLDRSAPYTYDRYGWADIDNARIERCHDGYWLNLPKPIEID